MQGSQLMLRDEWRLVKVREDLLTPSFEDGHISTKISKNEDKKDLKNGDKKMGIKKGDKKEAGKAN